MGRAAGLIRKLRTFVRMGRFAQALVPVSVLGLGIARAAILLLPFRCYAGVLGQPMAPASLHEMPAFSDAAPTDYGPAGFERARAIGRAVTGAAGITPWRSLCLAQALVACALLRTCGIDYIARLGVARDGEGKKGLRAHAWVRVGPHAVTGGRRTGRYAVVACFSGARQMLDERCSPA